MTETNLKKQVKELLGLTFGGILVAAGYQFLVKFVKVNEMMDAFLMEELLITSGFLVALLMSLLIFTWSLVVAAYIVKRKGGNNE